MKLAAYAAAAAGIAVTPPSVIALQHKVAGIQAKDVAQQAQIAALQEKVQADETARHDNDVCVYALLSDRLDVHTKAVNSIFAYLLPNSTPAPTPPRYDDQGACQHVGITRP